MPSRRVVVDVPLVLTALILSAYGISMVYSAGQTDVPTSATHAWASQLRWLILGLVAAYGVSRASVRFFEWAALPAYLLSLLLLALLLVIGTGAGTAASHKSWIGIGGFRLGQPSELAKV
ncbi:MAG: FtsW/RodA/SpoVE family cell cycle protein, partial [Gemmatimonadaceae bacterium]